MNRKLKQNVDPGNREDNIDDESRDTKVSSSKDSKTKQGGRQSKYLIPSVSNKKTILLLSWRSTNNLMILYQILH